MEKGIIVGLNINNDKAFIESMKELEKLAEACHIEIILNITQNKIKPSNKYYIGTGKVDELKEAIEELEPDLVIFDDELSPSQIRNLEEILEIKVIDRTVLILDIFARRALTTEAKLQVELAQSEYMLPRVIGMYKSLSRQKSGTGSKGPGEQKLELDRRLLRNKVTKLKNELQEIVENRRTQRKNRQNSPIPIVSLAGYTNAGKSTLMNALVDESSNHEKKYAFRKNMLFATLETKAKKIDLSDSKNFILTDTVGFIKKLPHHLIEAFKSTLEEISEADLLLHVIDVSNEDYKSQIEAVNNVLKEINADQIPVIYIYNKSDLIEEHPMVDTENSIFISAENHTNIDKLLDLINESLEKNSKLVELLLPYDKGDIFSYLKEYKSIESTSYENEGIKLQLKLNKNEIDKYKQYIV
ncbi:MAG: GTPase HflX [Tenericutes bacterium]|jgi:GTP-binding protein HflX|nr:GTPase HflX [Mycoplasmatota bacterium]